MALSFKLNKPRQRIEWKVFDDLIDDLVDILR